ncbi:hypothetical protein [Nocardia transvalensis]|uniref:hypothetical protein n=1 Tax=Nocardia transvalensis TaxID=37333 RepID=UPI0018937DCB|nr:hypothetical protein [Nocardia transvalensis]MBF6330307.1 hypothetical protein [Nocardia transvalensis]
MKAHRKIPVDMLSGPGVPGREDEVPLLHFDLTADETRRLLADPLRFVNENLDLTAEQRSYVVIDDTLTAQVSEYVWTQDKGWLPAVPAAMTVLPPDGGADGGVPHHPTCAHFGSNIINIHGHPPEHSGPDIEHG